MKTEDELFVGEILRDKTDNAKKYMIKEIAPYYWGDGATGYKLVGYLHGNSYGIHFWVRPEELDMLYRRFADRPMFPKS